MNELTFARPEQWPWLLALVPFCWLLVVAARGARRRAARYGGKLGEAPAGPWSQALLLTAVAAFLLLAVLEPQLGEEQVKVERRGVDVVFCLDVSRSMLAQDVDPNRLERARRDVVSLADVLTAGDRVGLVAFAGQARLVVPLTHDVDSFRELLRGVDTETVMVGGSDLAAAIRKGLELVDDDGTQTAVIVLLTDGEDLAGAGKTAAQEAAAKGVVVHAVGYGSTMGSKILLADGGRQGFLRSKEGEEVVSMLDPDGLRALAQTTGGEFLRADAAAVPLALLYERRIAPMIQRSYDAGAETLRKTRFQWVLLPAFVLLCIELFRLGGRRS